MMDEKQLQTKDNCPHCGAENVDHSKYECGSRIDYDVYSVFLARTGTCRLRAQVARIKELEKYEAFIRHIQDHLEEGQMVVCKICNKTIDEIHAEAKNENND